MFPRALAESDGEYGLTLPVQISLVAHSALSSSRRLPVRAWSAPQPQQKHQARYLPSPVISPGRLLKMLIKTSLMSSDGRCKSNN